MDFLKALMLYMTVTFASTVQVAPTPEITPVPTPAPTAVVTQAPAPAETETEAIAAAVAVATVAPAAVEITPQPEATITPNPAYKTLNRGSRGENVKKLQERLAELGYLTGTIDGAYGAKTQKAVRLFQYHNGLHQDGVAGKATQTILFESPDVIPNPDMATATPVPAETEAPTPEPTVDPAAKTAEEIKSGLQQVAGASCVLNDAGAPMTCLRMEDGVLIEDKPRIYADGDRIYIDLNDLTAAVADWQLDKAADGTWTLTAAGYTVTVAADEKGKGYDVSVDGNEMHMDSTYLLSQGSDLLADADFLDMTLGAEVVWDSEEKALMLHVAGAGTSAD